MRIRRKLSAVTVCLFVAGLQALVASPASACTEEFPSVGCTYQMLCRNKHVRPHC